MVVQDFPISEDTAAVLRQFAVFPIAGRYYQGVCLNDAVTGNALVVNSDGSINPPKGTKTIGAVSCAAVTQILAANATRITALIQNVSGADVYIGPTNGVLTTTGFLLRAGDTYSDGDSTDAWWGITTGAAAAIRTIEVA